MLDFILTSALLGVGLAMDAFTVSLANGLNEPDMRRSRRLLIAGVFAFFQFIMPLAGYAGMRLAEKGIRQLAEIVPYIAAALLGWIGGKMIWEGLHGSPEDSPPALGIGALLMQGIATSLDALSSGFVLLELGYSPVRALGAAGIIAVVTFAICVAGVALGKRFGVRLAGKAQIAGGVILIAIGVRILIGSFI
ncbi:MAG: manganese efflux pump [Clostridia bacterium]|nr:manganese efflux pump [Clostridia bacterium]MCR4576688.1 manganese efflux pump MntP family protein [Clostridiales bacterium]